MPLFDCSRSKRFLLRRLILFVLPALLVGIGGRADSQNAQRTLENLPAQKGCEGNTATLDVSSQRMTFDSKNRTFVFEEKVRVLRCAMTITCEYLQVIRSEKGDAIERIVATQKVRFQQGTRSGVAERAEYFELDQKLVLTGSPRVWDTQDHNELVGDEITVMLQEERVFVKQARVLFHPRKTAIKTP